MSQSQDVVRKPLRVIFLSEDDRSEDTLQVTKSEFSDFFDEAVFGNLDSTIRRIVLCPKFGKARRITIDRA